MMPVSRAAMNKIVMNHLVTEGLKVRPRVCHDNSVHGSHEQAHHELSCDFMSWRDSG
jgi:hypothetical protein